LYIAGDTIFCKEVKDALDNYKPDIVVVNAGAAQDEGKTSIEGRFLNFEEATHRTQ
jgi:hypothetical protein